MKKQFITTFIISSLLVTTNFFYSCAEYTNEELPIAGNPKSGTVQIKILSGANAGKTITNSGAGAVVGMKRFIENKFVGYQIMGTYSNLIFLGGVFNEDGTSPFEDLSISIEDKTNGYAYFAVDDSEGSIKLTDIKLLDSYDAVGAQFINGKLTFKGKFERTNDKLETVEENIEIEGTVTF